MTISSSLNAGVAGLNANASRLATISDNIANASTYGYRRVTTDFHSMVLDGSGSYSAGGVRTSTMRLVDAPGTLISTDNATDLALDGRGFFPVTDITAVEQGSELPLMLTSTGSFRPDANGILRDAAGLVLMGWPSQPDGTIPDNPRDTAGALEPVSVNLNQFASNPTTEIEMGINLPASETAAGAEGTAQVLTVEYFDNVGMAQQLDITFTPTPGGDGPSNEWTMQIADSAQDGAVVGDYTLSFDASATAGGTLAAVATTLGGAYDPEMGTMTIQAEGGPITLAIGQPGDPAGMTQLSDMFAPTAVRKNGSPVGNLVSVEVDSKGMVQAIYDTGFTRTIYQVPIADVPNPNGLIALDNQAYRLSPDSGAMFLWDAGTGPTGSVQSYAREESATDVAAELTQLIETQRAYSSNAKVIQTVDAMLQETTNIKR
ncbi:flagellar hook protein FlgE [Rhodovulum adriaticum]|uniref:Flagellar hook protein FlgE n=1 Tax=Rhodovulum adriaticum TaxID=35804 RepID=A0A4R2NZM4_RHOAD|nr:flagellar hook-basal body complex protein [Rhodovulum adriaticum]MBK1634788.1 flagellar biosynthesis protein FlgE [Rhodovulum adriaticum]TCP27637.1 flagellar hook protein FlgE [Rhodovulum adriaticum]